MEATITNFRLGGNRQYNNQVIIEVPGIHDREKAKLLIGKKVIWTSPKKKELPNSINSISTPIIATDAITKKIRSTR